MEPNLAHLHMELVCQVLRRCHIHTTLQMGGGVFSVLPSAPCGAARENPDGRVVGVGWGGGHGWDDGQAAGWREASENWRTERETTTACLVRSSLGQAIPGKERR